MNIKRILPMEMNLYLKNIKYFNNQTEYNLRGNSDGNIRCFYMDAASYNNLGDQAIALSTELFLKDLFGANNVYVINETEVISYLNSLKKQIKSADVIVLSGGGNMGDLYPRYEAIRRLIIKTFPDNKIVVFPQTIDYTEDSYGKRELEKSQRIYSKHKNLWVCAREEQSYQRMRKLYKNVLLIPDIVFYLKDKIRIENITEKDQSVGVCLRDDKESVLTFEEKTRIYELANLHGQSVKLTTMADGKLQFLNGKERMIEIKKKIVEFSSCKIIVTDRLHGMIFSLIAGVPCVAIDNTNHKVSGVYKTIESVFKSVCILTNEHIKTMQNISTPKRENTTLNTEQMYRNLRNILLKEN